MSLVLDLLSHDPFPAGISVGLLVLRFGLGVALLTHGLQKIVHFSKVVANFPSVLGLNRKLSLMGAIFGEVFVNLLLMVGLFGHIPAICLTIMFSMIFFVVHHGLPFAKKELPFLFLLGFFVLSIVGPGSYSIEWMPLV